MTMFERMKCNQHDGAVTIEIDLKIRRCRHRQLMLILIFDACYGYIAAVTGVGNALNHDL